MELKMSVALPTMILTSYNNAGIISFHYLL